MSEQALPFGEVSALQEGRDSVALPDELNELNYRPVPVLAPITLVFGLASVTGIGYIPCLAFGVTGVILGGITLLIIRRSAGVYAGKKIAWAGLILSFIFLAAGSSLHAYDYVTEVPPGYERLNFYWLSKQTPLKVDGRTKIHPDAEKLNGTKVLVKGYMYPTGKLTGLTEFMLCKDTGQCCFGGNPKMEDTIQVVFKNGVTADHRELKLVRVGGILKTKPVYKKAVLTQIYTLEADYFK